MMQNKVHLKRLAAVDFQYQATDSGIRPALLDSLMAESLVTLKLGAQVMLIKNVDSVLVNGLVGKVIGFYHAWEILLGDTDEVSSGRTVLRNVTLDSGYRAIRRDTQCVGKAKDEERYPLVLFEYSSPRLKGEVVVEAVLISREEFRIEDPEGKLIARRVQL